jgi:hypothetical protein
MRTPPVRPLVAAAATLVVSVTALTGHAATTRPVSDHDALAAGRTAAAADQRLTTLAREASQAAARRAADDAARARAEQARAAARAAERKAAQQAAARKAAAHKAARKAAQAKARAKAQAAARAKAAAAAKARATRSSARAAASAPARTGWAALNQAIARIPGYRDGIANWHVTSRFGHYGITDANQPGAANIYISPTVPVSKLYSVAAHEYGHAVVIANYGTGYGPYTRYSRDMVAWFGGTTVTGLERAADCIALRLGATWTNYTGCGDPHWQEGARILLGGGTL